MAWGKTLDEINQGFPREAPSGDAPLQRSLVAEERPVYEQELRPKSEPGMNYYLNDKFFQPQMTDEQTRNFRDSRDIQDYLKNGRELPNRDIPLTRRELRFDYWRSRKPRSLD